MTRDSAEKAIYPEALPAIHLPEKPMTDAEIEHRKVRNRVIGVAIGIVLVSAVIALSTVSYVEFLG